MLFRVHVHGFCLTAALLAASPVMSAESDAVAGDPLGSHVRGATPAVKALIARGAQRSPTFKGLIEQLNASDVVVYLETTEALPARLDGRLVFITAAGGVRYLRVQVAPGLGFEQLIAVAGHELQHALEVAMHPEVRDTDGMRTLYERIGVASGIRDRYDTVAAQSTGRRVRAEMS
jgi:hypothetical protein